MKSIYDIYEGVLDVDANLVDYDKIMKRADRALDVKCDNFDEVIKVVSAFFGTKLKITKTSASILNSHYSNTKLKLSNAKMIKMSTPRGHMYYTIKFILQDDNLICQLLKWVKWRDIYAKGADHYTTEPIRTEYKSFLCGFMDKYEWGTSLWEWLCGDKNIKEMLSNIK